MWILGKKPVNAEAPVRRGRGEIPVEKAYSLSRRGYQEKDVIDVLRAEGYSAEEIDSALGQALKAGVAAPEHAATPGQQFGPMQPPREYAPRDFPMKPQPAPQPYIPQPPQPAEQYEAQQPSFAYEQPPKQEEEEPAWQQQFQAQPQFPEISEPEPQGVPVAVRPEVHEEAIEEVVESLVEEKWGQLENRLVSVGDRMREMEKRVHDIEVQVSTFKDINKTSEGSIEGKLDSYQNNLSQIEARIGSIERAFKETLPSMIDSVRSISEIVQKLKAK